MRLEYLGGLTANDFLREYWQKKPLLVRKAFPTFNGLLTPDQLISLACHEDVEARLVNYANSKWRLRHGPLSAEDFSKKPRRNWTLLVQDLNHFLPSAMELLEQFKFIPYARMDDVMVSYATPGGGVGPHFDSYDVFLLQGMGKRRWRISSQKNLDLVPDAPLKILEAFHPQEEWILEAGDMLYLPPKYAHDGVALTECMTYSVGFRAPAKQELASAFLCYLQDHLSIEGRYEDHNLAATKFPGEISTQMIEKTVTAFHEIQWGKKMIVDFLGVYLSEPKPHVLFATSTTSLPLAKFKSAIRKAGVRLASKSRMLYRNNVFYLNGERFPAQKSSVDFLRMLADNRQATCKKNLDETTLEVIWEWYTAGYIELNSPRKKTRLKSGDAGHEKRR